MIPGWTRAYPRWWHARPEHCLWGTCTHAESCQTRVRALECHAQAHAQAQIPLTCGLLFGQGAGHGSLRCFKSRVAASQSGGGGLGCAERLPCGGLNPTGGPPGLGGICCGGIPGLGAPENGGAPPGAGCVGGLMTGAPVTYTGIHLITQSSQMYPWWALMEAAYAEIPRI